MARDLHDILGQQLTALQLHLESLKEACRGQEELLRKVGQAQELVHRLDSEVDFIAWELRPAALDVVGLSAALENYAHEWSEHYGVEAEYRASGLSAGRLAPAVEINLYRIMQEALNNVYKHAAASRAGVMVERRDGQVVLIVEDDGKGFEPGRAVDGERGMGLVSMRERAAQVGGTLEIESTQGAGTTLYVRVPAVEVGAGGASPSS
jgi:signal transduction histidine kinase